MHRRADRPLGVRKARDRALVLPLIGLILLLPPVASIVPTGVRVGGVPLVLAYIFLVWAGLIAVAAALSRGLAKEDAASASSRAQNK